MSEALSTTLPRPSEIHKGMRVLIADGRTHLWHSRELYDVIVSQPTNPWIAGVGDLYTRVLC